MSTTRPHNAASAPMSPALERAWLVRYLDRQLDSGETAWFEARLLRRPVLLTAVDLEVRLRSAAAFCTQRTPVRIAAGGRALPQDDDSTGAHRSNAAPGADRISGDGRRTVDAGISHWEQAIMGKIFDVDDAPGSELRILELDAPTLSGLIGRDFIINRVRGADEIFAACDLVRIQIHHVQGGLQLILLIEHEQQTVYSVALSVVTHAGFDLWLAGSDDENRDVVLFVKPDGLSPEGKPCARIRILVFTVGDPRTRPDEYQYTETVGELPPPEPEPACDSGGMAKASEDDESEGYTER